MLIGVIRGPIRGYIIKGVLEMQILKRIIYFISLFFIYIIIRELIELYYNAQSIHPIFGYAVLAIILIAFIYFVFVPLYKIFTLPVNPGPVLSKSKEEDPATAEA